MEKIFKILNLSPDSTKEEVDSAYHTLKTQYTNDMFTSGKEGETAAKKLTELENAYREYSDAFTFKSDSSDLYKVVKDSIMAGDLQKAQNTLDSFNERDAEWHYLQSIVFFKKSWFNESKKQLEIAVSMAPDVTKYKDELQKVNNYIMSDNANSNWNHSGNATYSDDPTQRQMGGGSCLDLCCQIIACNALLNCCCNCR